MKDLKKIILAEELEYKELEDGTLMIQKKERAPFELELGKDYIHNEGDWLVINMSGGRNSGFTNLGDVFRYDLFCSNPEEWREATKEEVVKFFERNLIKRYGEDWKNVKLKKCMDQDDEYANKGLNSVDIDEYDSFWMVWNKNGCLFNGEEWAEVLEPKKVVTNLNEIERPYYISLMGDITCADTGIRQTKNHMSSEELCEGILALQQLIAFRDNFYEVHGGVCKASRSTIKLEDEVFRIYITRHETSIFDFAEHEQAEEFLSDHKELFEELKKLY